MTINELQQKLDRQFGRLEEIESLIKKSKTKLKITRRSLKDHVRAREIVREVGIKTQQQLQYHISDITTLALESIFNDPYKLSVEFVQRRNKTECDLLFERDNSKVDPLSASGGGAVDVASFALRIASWSMETPKSRPTIILDEPFHFLSQDLQAKASEMVKELSNKLGIQFIIVTHETAFTPFADKIFSTRIRKGVTRVKTN